MIICIVKVFVDDSMELKKLNVFPFFILYLFSKNFGKKCLIGQYIKRTKKGKGLRTQFSGCEKTNISYTIDYSAKNNIPEHMLI